jgi:hypothetical protein
MFGRVGYLNIGYDIVGLIIAILYTLINDVSIVNAIVATKLLTIRHTDTFVRAGGFV